MLEPAKTSADMLIALLAEAIEALVAIELIMHPISFGRDEPLPTQNGQPPQRWLT